MISEYVFVTWYKLCWFFSILNSLRHMYCYMAKLISKLQKLFIKYVDKLLYACKMYELGVVVNHECKNSIPQGNSCGQAKISFPYQLFLNTRSFLVSVRKTHHQHTLVSNIEKKSNWLSLSLCRWKTNDYYHEKCLSVIFPYCIWDVALRKYRVTLKY